jgi:dephospho-CoA kinase
MKVCGLTGGVGMGKSTAARFFRERGAQIVDTDELARRLVQPGQPALAAIQSVFGKRVISLTGELNRAELAQIVFADADARKKLEAILHPLIREQWFAQIEAWRGENYPLAVVVIPLLFETRAESHFDKIICAACSTVAQRERLLARGWTPEQIEQRIAAQMPVEKKIARADFVIWTDGALDMHARQIERLLAAL